MADMASRLMVYRLQLLTIILATLTVSLVVLTASSCNEDRASSSPAPHGQSK
jgi:hypothetical protein